MPSNNMDMLNHDLQLLQNQGIKYVFIDEITLMQDFISVASLLSDVYAMFGMKIILSGTDSLGFAIASEEELYDRCLTIHTTFFKEIGQMKILVSSYPKCKALVNCVCSVLLIYSQ